MSAPRSFRPARPLSAALAVALALAAAPAAAADQFEGTVFFAGEATENEESGTVEAALASGHRAAREILRAIDKRR